MFTLSLQTNLRKRDGLQFETHISKDSSRNKIHNSLYNITITFTQKVVISRGRKDHAQESFVLQVVRVRDVTRAFIILEIVLRKRDLKFNRLTPLNSWSDIHKIICVKIHHKCLIQKQEKSKFELRSGSFLVMFTYCEYFI